MNPLILLLFLPSAVCLFWLAMNYFLARRTSTFLLLEFLTLDLLLFFMADGCYATPGISPDLMVYAHLFTVFCGTSVIPMLWLYFDRLRRRRRFYPIQFLWLLAPVALLISGIIFTEISDKTEIAKFITALYTEGASAAQAYKGTPMWHYYIWTSVFFRIVVGVEFVAAFIYLLKYAIERKEDMWGLWRFLNQGEPVKVLYLQLLNLILPGLYVVTKLIFLKGFLDTHIWISVLQAIAVTAGFSSFMFCSLFGEKDKITLVQARHVMFFNYNRHIKGPIVEIMMEELLDEAEQDALIRFRDKIGESIKGDEVTPKSLVSVKEHLFSNVAGTWDDSLMSRFQTLMLNEQLFLQPSLTLGDVADRLHTNKTYVSKMVNNSYNLGFPELLNTLRIDYAEQYILNHRDARQEEIARACGFLSASSFNNIFKKITGVTPKVWLVSNGNKSQQ